MKKQIDWKRRRKRQTCEQYIKARIDVNRRRLEVGREPACIAQEIAWLARGKQAERDAVRERLAVLTQDREKQR
jgi:hypothetical protein